jgi:hypothetical protein
MKKIALMVAALAATVSTTAHATDWVNVGESVTDSTFFMDADSVRITGTYRFTVWVATAYGQASPGGAIGNKALTEFDCALQRKRVLSVSYLGTGGRIITSVDSTQAWEYLVPDSVLGDTLQAICAETQE